MNLFFTIALKLRLDFKWIGKLFMWHRKRTINYIVKNIDMDVKDITMLHKLLN